MQDFDVDYMQLDSDNDCVKEINNFLSENTNNHIDNIIITREDSILKEKYISIVNALYIDSEWDNHFTSIDPILFHIAPFSPYSTRVAQRIYRLIENEEWNFTQGATWKCIGIPYKHRKTWLHILLPNEKSGLNQLINIFDTAMLKQCITKNIPGKMEVMIPVFDIESTICLNQIFIKLGVTNIFEEDNKQKNTCNFHKIFQATKINVNQTGLRQRSPPQCTSEALNEVKKMERKVLNEYDREEWIRMEREEEPVTFFANYPFLYFITLVNESVEDLKSVIAMGKYC
uniref:Serpin domain-containing protein n=1 Tax=Panagrolaimus sp. ES5 TaxID=591445 RepID=A0AC34F599_9BILA